MPTRIAAQLLGGATLALLIGNAVQWGVWSWQVRLIQSDRDLYKARIEDPETGYVRQINQCLSNDVTLKEGLAASKASIDKAAADGKARDDALRADMKGAAKDAQNELALAAKNLAKPSVTPPGSLQSCQAGEAIFRGRAP